MKQKSIFVAIICFIISVGCQQKTSVPKIAFPPNGGNQLTIDEASTRIVSKDTNESVNIDDIRVKRVRYLLTELTKEGSLSLYDSCNLVEVSIDILDNNNGIKMSMQEFLEEMKKTKDSEIPTILSQKSDFMSLAASVFVRKGR